MSQLVKFFELFALVCAFLNWKNVRQNVFLKNLTILVLIITILEFTGFYIWKTHRNNLWYYNTIAIPATFSVYGLIIYTELKKESFVKLIVVAMFLLFCSYWVSYFFIDAKKQFCMLGYCVGAAMVAAFGMFKISLIINDKNEIDFLKTPLFYLMLALVVYYLVTVPYYIFGYFLRPTPSAEILSSILFYTTVILNYCLYITYSFTFLWVKKK